MKNNRSKAASAEMLIYQSLASFLSKSSAEELFDGARLCPSDIKLLNKVMFNIEQHFWDVSEECPKIWETRTTSVL